MSQVFKMFFTAFHLQGPGARCSPFHLTAHKLISKGLHTPISMFLANLEKTVLFWFIRFIRTFLKVDQQIGDGYCCIGCCFFLFHNLREKRPVPLSKQSGMFYKFWWHTGRKSLMGASNAMGLTMSLLSSFALVTWWVKDRKKGKKEMGSDHGQTLADCLHNVHIHELIIIKDKKYFISLIENIHYCTPLASGI